MFVVNENFGVFITRSSLFIQFVFVWLQPSTVIFPTQSKKNWVVNNLLDARGVYLIFGAKVGAFKRERCLFS